jgi:hypothetical protein
MFHGVFVFYSDDTGGLPGSSRRAGKSLDKDGADFLNLVGNPAGVIFARVA